MGPWAVKGHSSGPLYSGTGDWLVLTESALVVHVRGDTWRRHRAPGSHSPAAGLGHHTQVVPAKWSVTKLEESEHNTALSYLILSLVWVLLAGVHVRIHPHISCKRRRDLINDEKIV